MAEDVFFTRCASPLGPLTLACRGEALTGLWMAGQKYYAATLPAGAVPDPDAAPLRRAAAWLDRYFARARPDGAELLLAPEGTAFQRRVWALLREIPYGETRSYGALAAALGSAPRAVGAAVGRNPISLLIPCHRVLGADGSLTGYAGGTDRKLWLLRHEGALPGDEEENERTL